MPLLISATRGVGLPGHGTFATPLVTTAPRRDKSTKSLYSMPEPNVPDAVITGFFNSTPAIFTLKSAIFLYSCLFPSCVKRTFAIRFAALLQIHLLFSSLPGILFTAPLLRPGIPDLLCRPACCVPVNAHPPQSICKHTRGRRQFRRPCVPPSKSSIRFRAPLHKI